MAFFDDFADNVKCDVLFHMTREPSDDAFINMFVSLQEEKMHLRLSYIFQLFWWPRQDSNLQPAP